MKYFLLNLLVLLLGRAQAQQTTVSNLPAGRYETALRTDAARWERGDIILIDKEHYRVSSSDEVGEYRFSTAAQRIFFTSGPLKAVFAKVVQQGQKPAILLPFAENSAQHLASADLMAVFKQ